MTYVRAIRMAELVTAGIENGTQQGTLVRLDGCVMFVRLDGARAAMRQP